MMAHRYKFRESSQSMLSSLLFLLLLVVSLANSSEVGKKNILVFGGNGFIGASTVQKLFGDGHKVTIVNRGNWYWDTQETVLPFVSHIRCDRYQGGFIKTSCPGLVKYVKSTDPIDFVVDFSAFDHKAVSEALELLGTKPGVYIYISTDSVYEVVEKGHPRPWVEVDSQRPENPDLRETLAKRDSYGHEKLAAEEVLVKARKESRGPPYIFLRLPDVLGPRDNTDRWLQYQLWLKMSSVLDKPVLLPSHLQRQPLSLIYVEDAANLIRVIVNNESNQKILDNAYNLAFEETYFLKDILYAIKENIGAKHAKIERVDSSKNPYFLFPSVTNGPMNITKAVTMLPWKTTPWNEMVKTTTSFYEDMMRNTEKFSWHIEKVLYKLKYSLFRGMESQVDRFLMEEYGYKKRAKDEL